MKNDYFNTFEKGDIEIREDIELDIEPEEDMGQSMS